MRLARLPLLLAALLAPETHWITGQRIEVTGGYRL